jgi:HrpA-like RNA helicase
MDIILKNIDDILDSKASNKNFLTNNEYSEEYINLAKNWSQLPMYTDTESIKKFFNLYHKNNVMLLISGTGSGKTVLVPKYVLKYNNTLRNYDNKEISPLKLCFFICKL